MAAGTRRRLTTIVAADIAGYSRLVRADEEGTLAAIRAHRSELIDDLIAKHGGRVANTAGDSILMEFPSAVEAVRCSIAVQQGMDERNAELSQAERIEFRIGINVGDVIAQGDDLLGDGVNVAARLEGLAEPGGICLSHTVHDQVRDRFEALFEDLGNQEVKNIARPVRVWQWSPKTSNEADPVKRETALPLPDKPSIAVLPFDNMSGDPEQEYFSDGISEDIITALSKVHWLFVIARNSTFTYKGSAMDVTRVAKELGVRYVVEGSVRKAGNKARITAQLIDGANGSHVWAERYDRELDDVFAVQDEITENIVGRIDNEVRVSEIDRARRKPPANLDAWELYQRGLWYAFKATPADNEAAGNLFQQAVERDRGFALAHAGISFTCSMEVFHGFSDNPDAWLAKGLAAGEQAVALDDKDGFSHFALGRVLTLTGQGDRAIAALEKSVALNPNLALGYHGLGLALGWYGRAADGLPKLDMAMRLSPHDPMLWGMQVVRAQCCNAIENYIEGAEWARKSLNERPEMIITHFHMAVALAGQGRLDEARLALAAARRVRPDLSASVIRRLFPHYHLEYIDRFLDVVRKVGLPEE